jgi:hypothetical protein
MKKLLVVLSFLFTSANVQAVLLTDLVNGGEMVVADKLFHGFEVLFEDSSDGRSFDYDNIDITGLPDGGLDPGPGLKYDISNGMFDVTGDGIYAYVDFQIGFYVSVLDPLLYIKDNSLYLTEYDLISPFFLAGVTIQEEIFDLSGNWLGDKLVEAYDFGNGETSTLYDDAEFTPVKDIWVTVNILVDAIEFDEGASLTSFEQRFSQTREVSEPGILGLFALGIGVLVIRLRRG